MDRNHVVHVVLAVVLYGSPAISQAQQPKTNSAPVVKPTTSSSPVAQTCDANGPNSPSSWELSVALDFLAHPEAFKAAGLCKLSEDELRVILDSPGMVAKNNGEVMYVGFQRKKGADYSKVRVFIDSVSDSHATTDRFIERVADNPFATIVYSRGDADVVFHTYATENASQTIFLITVNDGVPVKWQGRTDEDLELAVGSPGIGMGRDPASATDDIYDTKVFPVIERVHKLLVEWEKTSSTGILIAR
jgi:hypothetical protein